MGIIDMLRLRNIFGPQNPQMGQVNFPEIPMGSPMENPNPMVDSPMATPPIAPMPDFDPMARMKQLYSPETMATDRYNELIGQMPRMQDYQPGKMRSLGGALMSVASSFGPRGVEFNPEGVQSGMDFVNQPFTNQLTDWQRQVQPSYQAAQLERYANQGERALAQSIVSQERQMKKDEATAELNKQKLVLQEWKTKNPNSKIIQSKDGRLLGVDPQTNEVTDLGKVGLSQAELANLNQKNALERIEKQGDIRINLAEGKPGEVFIIDDPDNPGQKIAAQRNSKTGNLEKLKFGDQDVTGITKPGTTGRGIQPKNTEYLKSKAAEIQSVIREIVDEKGKLKPNIKMAVGKSRLSMAHRIEGTEAYSADKTIKRLKDMLTNEFIQELRRESERGTTAYGALNLKELGVLESAASKIDPGLKEEVLEAEIKRVIEKLALTQQPEDGFTPTTVPKKLTAAERIQQFRDQGKK